MNMSMHGGFENTGSISSIIKYIDSRINAITGDIVIYNSNHICFFYNTSIWSYIDLRHISFPNNKLNDLFD